MAAPEAVVLNISEMIDFAIGTPEVGAVDFNMLQTVLHCLAQQLRVLDKHVELRGSATAAVPPAGPGRDSVQTIAISEFVVDTGAPQGTYKEVKPTAQAKGPGGAEESILIVERVKRTDSLTGTRPAAGKAPAASKASPAAATAPPAAATAPPAAGTAPPTAGVAPSAVRIAPSSMRIAPVTGSTERLSLVTISKFNVLEGTVKDLKDRVYGTSPKNEEILQEVRSQTNLKAITDMWTNLNVSARLEATENGIAKLSSLVQDLISETGDLQRRASAIFVQPGGAKSVMDAAGGTVGQAKSVTAAAIPAKSVMAADLQAKSVMATDLQAKSVMATDLKAKSVMAADPKAKSVMAAPSQYGGEIEGTGTKSRLGMQAISTVAIPALNDLADVQLELQRLRDDHNLLAEMFGRTMEQMNVGSVLGLESAGKSVRAMDGIGGVEAAGSLVDKLLIMEQQVKEWTDRVNKTEGKMKDHISSLQDQIEYVMKQAFGDVPPQFKKTESESALSPDLVKDLQGLMQLFTTVQQMQAQLTEVHDTALQLAAEKEDRQHHINTLLEQIELLKIVKMDREDMIEAMAEKADMRALARKVSHDQFEMACDDLSRGLEHALGKLGMQEALWQQALDDIQREIETKLDKLELSPVKEFFNNKLKQLQDNLKQMASLRREAEAAGTKRKLLRDVNCISCDAQAVMAMEVTNLGGPKPLNANLSMKPYLCYELDAIRKAQAANVQQRNMHDWETIDKQMVPAKPLQKARSETDKHICNRYCGGSHTVTTAAQRVARLGHFVKQWGPEVLPLSSALASGDDGKMYKVTTEVCTPMGPGGTLDAVCTPKAPRKSETKPPQKPIIISAECRCLEGERPSKS